MLAMLGRLSFDARIGCSHSTYSGVRDMSFRFSPRATGLLVVVALALMSGLAWAHFYELGPSKDEWGLKYAAEVTAVDGDKLKVTFTLADQGRLKPIYSVSIVAFSDMRPGGGRAYLLNTAFDLKPTKDGKLTGELQIDKKFADRAMIRIMTLTFDGKPQTAGARYYQMPVKKFMKKAPAGDSTQALPSIASPATSKVTK